MRLFDKKYSSITIGYIVEEKLILIEINQLYKETSRFEVIERNEMCNLKNLLIINLKFEDEKEFIRNELDTISLTKLISIYARYPFKYEDISGIIFKTTKVGNWILNSNTNTSIDYKDILFNPEFWYKFVCLIKWCIDGIRDKGLLVHLMLEIRINPILDRMFSQGYFIDCGKVRRIYKSFTNQLQSSKKNGKEENLKLKFDNLNMELAEIQYHKIKEKIMRIPYEIIKNYQGIIKLNCSYSSIGTKTFRITTSKYNMQGLPKRVRQCFVPRKGNALVEYDIVSSQLYLLSCLSGEERLIKVYEDKGELYTTFAELFWNKSEESISEEMRNATKKAVIMKLYGASNSSISKEIIYMMGRTDLNNLNDRIDRLFLPFQKINTYINMVEKTERIKLPYGIIFESKGKEYSRKKLAYILQELESVILKLSIIDICNRIKNSRVNAWLYLTIHDSVILDIDFSCVEKIREIVTKAFNSSIKKISKKEINLKETILCTI